MTNRHLMLWGVKATAGYYAVRAVAAQAANTSATLQGVKSEMDGLLGLIWLLAGIALVIYGLYEVMKYVGTREYGAGLQGVVGFLLGASMIVYVIPQFSSKATALGATLDDVAAIEYVLPTETRYEISLDR